MDGGSSLTAAVIITAIVGIFTLIIGRGSKISEFRQAWINDQRKDLAAWGAAALSLARGNSTDRAADYHSLEEAAYRIRLRENPTKREWADVIRDMDAVRDKLLANDRTAFDVFPELRGIADGAQRRLKRDWNKVRRGEVGYQVLCFLFPALFAVLLLIGYYTIYPDESPFRTEQKKPAEQHLSGTLQVELRQARPSAAQANKGPERPVSRPPAPDRVARD